MWSERMGELKEGVINDIEPSKILKEVEDNTFNFKYIAEGLGIDNKISIKYAEYIQKLEHLYYLLIALEKKKNILEKDLSLMKSEVYLNVSMSKDDEGKKLFTNDKTRDIELKRRLYNNHKYMEIIKEVQELEERQKKNMIEKDMLLMKIEFFKAILKR